MKKIIGIALAAVCLLGCKQGKKELHDPLLRQQLTTIVSSLDDQNKKAADQASKDIDAILSVNSAKMSQEQKQKLSSANSLLSQVNAEFAVRELHEAMHPGDKNPSDDISDYISQAKKTLSEVAATF